MTYEEAKKEYTKNLQKFLKLKKENPKLFQDHLYFAKGSCGNMLKFMKLQELKSQYKKYK